VLKLIEEQASHNDDEDNTYAKTVKNCAMWGALIITIPCMLATLYVALLYSKGDVGVLIVLIPIACNLITQIICFSLIISRAQKTVDAFSVKQDNVKAYSGFGECSSKYMAMSPTVSSDIMKGISYMTQAKNMGIAMLACVGLVIILPLFGVNCKQDCFNNDRPRLISQESLLDMGDECLFKEESLNDSFEPQSKF